MPYDQQVDQSAAPPGSWEIDDYSEGLRVERALAYLRGISDPVARVRAADVLAEHARGVQGSIGQIRRRAIYEATMRPGHTGESVAAELQISAKAVSAAISEFRAEDRKLFRSALEVLMRPDVSRAPREQLAPGLTARDVLVQARLVLLAEEDYDIGNVSDEEFDLLEIARERARAIHQASGADTPKDPPWRVTLSRREPIDWTSVDQRIINVVRTIDAMPGIAAVSWVYPGSADWPRGDWGVAWQMLAANASETVFQAGPHRDGWASTEWLIWLSTDFSRSGFNLWQDVFSPPPYLNEPGESACFWIFGNLGGDKPMTPDQFVSDLRTTWDETGFTKIEWPGLNDN
jgi:hypothetical protein